MLAPLTTLNRAATRVHRSLHASLDAAGDLTDEALHNRPPPGDGDGDEAEESIEEMDPSDARGRIEEVYEPLMGGASRRSSRRSSVMLEEGDEVKVRKLEVYVAYLCFFILGACILLPWNSEMVAGGYFRARLEGSSLQQSYTSWMSLAFMASNLGFLYLANSTQQTANPAFRISTSIIVMGVLLGLGIISTRVNEIEPITFFAGLMLSTILLSACASYLQNAVVALSSRFGSMYLQGILSGQGAVGLAVAVLQFVAAYSATRSSETSPPSPRSLNLQHRSSELSLSAATPAQSIRDSAFAFFLTIAIFSGVCFLAHLILIKLPLYRLIQQAQADASAISGLKGGPSARVVERKVRKLGLSIAWVFVVTLSVFPSITSAVLSTNGPDEANFMGLGTTLSDPALFVPLGFIIFNAGDWIGRAMPQIKRLSFTDWRWLAAASAARTLFIPLFLLCNVHAGGLETNSPFISSDAVFLLLMLLFSVSNGYVSTLIMLAAVVDPVLEENEIDIAATCLAFYLTSGLAVGSLISFPIRATVCRCNPFVLNAPPHSPSYVQDVSRRNDTILRRSDLHQAPWHKHRRHLEKRASNASKPLRDLQVDHPPVIPKGGRTCEVQLLQHDFANSYYVPAIVSYVPPTGCGPVGAWAAIVLNITATSNGTQYDRLGSLSLSNVEIWRTSTAEPTTDGIIWTALKDVTSYNPLFGKEGRLMFDENNIYNSEYTGIYSTTLTVTFYEATPSFPTPPSADLILPLSTLSTTESQMFSYPGASSTNVTIPENTAEAYVEIYATGNSDEEFWYTNLPDQFSDDFAADEGVIAKGPFREVQLFIDETLAGVVIPFPVVYTGGANPLLWRPIVSLRAFDIPSFYIDITPFLGTLTDDASHNFTIIVIGQGTGDHSVNSDWYLSGNRTVGKLLSYVASPFPTITTTGGEEGSAVVAYVKANRTLEISALITTGTGSKIISTFLTYSYSNAQNYTNGGNTENVIQETSVTTTSTHDLELKLNDIYSFPITLYTDYNDYPDSYSASVGPYDYDRALVPPISGRGETTKSSQVGQATVSVNAAGTAYVGNSATSEVYSFLDLKGNSFYEDIKAVNSSVTSVSTSGTLAPSTPLPPFPFIPTSTYPFHTTQDGLVQAVGLALRPVAGGLSARTVANGGILPP